MEQNHTWESGISSASQEITRIYRTRMFDTVLARSRNGPPSWASWFHMNTVWWCKLNWFISGWGPMMGNLHVVMDFRVPYRDNNNLSSWETVSFSRRTVFHGVSVGLSWQWSMFAPFWSTAIHKLLASGCPNSAVPHVHFNTVLIIN